MYELDHLSWCHLEQIWPPPPRLTLLLPLLTRLLLIRSACTVHVMPFVAYPCRLCLAMIFRTFILCKCLRSGVHFHGCLFSSMPYHRIYLMENGFLSLPSLSLPLLLFVLYEFSKTQFLPFFPSWRGKGEGRGWWRRSKEQAVVNIHGARPRDLMLGLPQD